MTWKMIKKAILTSGMGLLASGCAAKCDLIHLSKEELRQEFNSGYLTGKISCVDGVDRYKWRK